MSYTGRHISRQLFNIPISHHNQKLTSWRRMSRVNDGDFSCSHGGGFRSGRSDRASIGLSCGCGDSLTLRAHSQCRGQQGITTVRSHNSRWGDFHCSQLFHLFLKPPVLFTQWPEPSLQVLTFHLRLFQLAPAHIWYGIITFYQILIIVSRRTIKLTPDDHHLQMTHLYICKIISIFVDAYVCGE